MRLLTRETWPDDVGEAAGVEDLLRSGDAGTTMATYQPGECVFSQGDPSESVMYLQAGMMKLSIVSRRGQEAVVGIVEEGTFFAESALTTDPVRHETATAMTEAVVLIIPKARMTRLLHGRQDFRDRFMAHLLARNRRLQGDLIDHLFNTSEKRLARALLLFAPGGRRGRRHRVRAAISQQTLADMIGTTRPRVNFFMNKFRRLGYIEYGAGLKVNDSLARVILRPERSLRRHSKSG